MGMTSFYSGGMRYSPCGRKRKTNAYTKKKRTPETRSVLVPTQAQKDAHQAHLEHQKKYPSFDLKQHTVKMNHEDNSWKLEESKKWTVAPAYNKGAYQVINKDMVKHIGK
ncbi:hypothetical protein CBD41_08820 [bacterium TMED181]|nr:MAG: hypothetical protein CBD41_08820 [bacterium TMED181]